MPFHNYLAGRTVGISDTLEKHFYRGLANLSRIFDSTAHRSKKRIAKRGFLLYIPILAGFIAYSIADRPGIALGMIGGVLASLTGAGFLGGIIAGFLSQQKIRSA